MRVGTPTLRATLPASPRWGCQQIDGLIVTKAAKGRARSGVTWVCPSRNGRLRTHAPDGGRSGHSGNRWGRSHRRTALPVAGGGVARVVLLPEGLHHGLEPVGHAPVPDALPALPVLPRAAVCLGPLGLPHVPNSELQRVGEGG